MMNKDLPCLNPNLPPKPCHHRWVLFGFSRHFEGDGLTNLFSVSRPCCSGRSLIDSTEKPVEVRERSVPRGPFDHLWEVLIFSSFTWSMRSWTGCLSWHGFFFLHLYGFRNRFHRSRKGWYSNESYSESFSFLPLAVAVAMVNTAMTQTARCIKPAITATRVLSYQISSSRFVKRDDSGEQNQENRFSRHQNESTRNLFLKGGVTSLHGDFKMVWANKNHQQKRAYTIYLAKS